MATIREEAILNNPPCRVWEEFHPKELSRWYRGRPKVQYEVQPGDKFRASGSFKLLARNGKVDVVLQAKGETFPDALVLSWSCQDRKEDWRVVWRLEPVEGSQKTRLVVADQRDPIGPVAKLAERLLAPSLLRRRYRSSLRNLRRRLEAP